jgi:GR25 family glycosyltransferase involved in LPS biosynthesis
MQFPHILVINLKDRKDRWKEIVKQLDTWDVPYERVEAVKHRVGWVGCNKSHLKCIQLAKERKYPWVLIIEDDCLFEPRGKERIEELLPHLWRDREEWDIFNAGGSYIFKAKVLRTRPYILDCSTYASQCVLHQERNYDKILKEAPGNKIDVYFKDRLYQWVTYPHIAIQQNGYSNIVKKKSNHRKTFGKSETILRNIIKKYLTRKRKRTRTF